MTFGLLSSLLGKLTLTSYLESIISPLISNRLDFKGKVAIVTGGTSIEGYEACKTLLTRGVTVYLATNSEARAKCAVELLEQETGRRAIFLKLDSSSYDGIKDSVDEFMCQEDQLDFLFRYKDEDETPCKVAYDIESYLPCSILNANGQLLATLLRPALTNESQIFIISLSEGFLRTNPYYSSLFGRLLGFLTREEVPQKEEVSLRRVGSRRM